MAGINPAAVQTWLEGRTEIDEFICPEKTLADVSFFSEKTDRHTPFAWIYLETPPNESRITYNSALTFPISKIGDVMGPVFLYLKISAFKFGPVLDSGVVRAVRAASLPDTPTGQTLGGLSKLDVLPTLVDYVGFATLNSVEFYSGTNRIDITSGDYTYLNQDMGVQQDKSWTYTLPSNQGGADNVATSGDQDIYVPLDLFWTRDIKSSLRHRALQYSDSSIKATLNSIPIRADALNFTPPDSDAAASELYASVNGPDVLPEDMYMRYAELRSSHAPLDITFDALVTNADAQLDAGFVPAVSLKFNASGGTVLTTQDTAVSDNVVKLVRRDTYQFHTSQLHSLFFPSLSSTSSQAFIWEYAQASSLVTFTPASTYTGGAGTATPGPSSVRLYGDLANARFASAAVKIEYRSPSVYRVSAVFDEDASTHIIQDIRMRATTGSANFDACPPTSFSPVLPGNMFFRVNPAVMDSLNPGDTWDLTLVDRALPLDFVISCQPWGDAVPTDFFEADASSSTAIFEYSDQLSSAYTAASLQLDSRSPSSIKGAALPRWLSVLDNGNILYYSTGSATPAAIRSALGGMIVGVPSDNLNFDYLQYDAGANVDVFSGGALHATGANGLFHPFFPNKALRPALDALPKGYTTLPVYMYEISNDPVYNTAVYTPLQDDNGIIKFGSTGIDTGGTLQKCSLLSTQFYLGEWERKEMGRLDYQQLISYTDDQQVALSRGDPSGRRVKIEFGGPCKELVFYFRPTAHLLDGPQNQRYWDWGTGPANALQDFFATCQLLINGQPLFPTSQGHPPMFFRHTIPCMNHASVPRQTCYTISFAWFPDMLSPSGSFNLSAVQTVELMFTYPNGSLQADGMLTIMGRMMNIYSVQHGMATAAFLQ
ncbi:hypothetical protein WJX74_003857 [Apatococcus lobatus]|uniref:Uncharacterized protein n=1 Tax=Apatococcus lobatus TaxID=904363 RepID=A0AAW1QZU0_9CHLO